MVNRQALSVILTVTLICSGKVFGQDEVATCDMRPNSDLPSAPNVAGTVKFSIVDGGNVQVDVKVNGFNKTDGLMVHGFHIHEVGDLSMGCTSTGSHFNPHNVNHGGRLNETRHVGDLGNIDEDVDGNVDVVFVDDVIKFDDSDNDIMGRAVVIHETFDDLGASGDPAGAAGARLACCIIVDSAAVHVNAFTTLPLILVSLWAAFKMI